MKVVLFSIGLLILMLAGTFIASYICFWVSWLWGIPLMVLWVWGAPELFTNLFYWVEDRYGTDKGG
jgi:hypothetical protein